MAEVPNNLPALTADDIQQFLLDTIPKGSPLWNRIMADIEQNQENGEVFRLVRVLSQQVIDRYQTVLNEVWKNAMTPDERFDEGHK